MSVVEDFVLPVLRSYEKYHRPLPWRATRDPYRIWVSEVILQQTRAQQAIPYYKRFLERFPSLHHLAESNEEEVLRCWQGLGYYARARHMREAARQLVNEQGGCFPSHPSELQKIKGIGPYTAAAIASFAFGYKAAVLDGNVFRLLSRYFGISDDIRASRTREIFMNRLDPLIKEQDPAHFNQAIMEFGAQQCRPRPLCPSCELRKSCYAFFHQKTHLLPYKSALRAPRLRYFYYFVFESPKGVLLRLRAAKDIWQGLYDFYAYESEVALPWEEVRGLCPEFSSYALSKQSPWQQHLLTHQTIRGMFSHFSVSASDANALCARYDLQHVPYEGLSQFPKPIFILNYLKTEKILLF